MPSYNHFGCQLCGGLFNGGNCLGYSSVGSGNEFVYDPNPYSYNETPNFFNQSPQHQYETYSCELCGDSPHYGFDCQTRTPLVYEQDPCSKQNFSNDKSPYYSMSLPQQFDCCEICEGPHYSSDCQAGNTPIYDQGPCYNQNFNDDQPLFYSLNRQQQFDCCKVCRGPHYSSDCQTRNQLIYEPNLGNNYDFPYFDQPSQFTPPQPIPLSELERKELITYMLKSQEQFIINQEKFNMDVQNEINHLQEMLNLRNSNQDPPVDLYDLKGSNEGDNEIDSLTKEPSDTFLMGDEVISTTLERENDEFIKSSVDDLVPNPRESEVTSVCDDLECDMPVNTHLPTTDVRKEDFDIKSPLGEQVVDFLMENVDVAGLPRHLVKQLFSHLVKNLSSTKRMSDESLGDDSKPRSYDVTSSNPLFNFNDDYTLCYDNILLDEEFENISSLDPPKSAPLNHEPLGNPDSVSRSLETSDLILEELTAEIGLDDSIPTKIDDGYYDSEGDILFLDHLLIEETFFDPTH
ncbi:hypothetical protein Tco_0539460 [Tanacetum coccineum]